MVSDPVRVIVELSPVECRVVGSLIEKAFLTPDIYPMTTNALVAACNQKTNREPVVSYDARTVDAALLELRQRNIVRRVHTPGARTTKHRSTLDELLDLDEAALALLSVLLLRGPQTVGELRLRTERHHGFENLEAVESCLAALASRPVPLVELLARQPGHKEARWRHVLGGADEAPAVDQVARSIGSGDHSPAPAVVPAQNSPTSAPSVAHSGDPVEPFAASAPSRPEAVQSGPQPAERLSSRIEALEDEVAKLRTQLRRLATQLGETLD